MGEIIGAATGSGGGKDFGDWWFSLTEKVEAPPQSLATQIQPIDNKVIMLGLAVLAIAVLGMFTIINK